MLEWAVRAQPLGGGGHCGTGKRGREGENSSETHVSVRGSGAVEGGTGPEGHRITASPKQHVSVLAPCCVSRSPGAQGLRSAHQPPSPPKPPSVRERNSPDSTHGALTCLAASPLHLNHCPSTVVSSSCPSTPGSLSPRGLSNSCSVQHLPAPGLPLCTGLNTFVLFASASCVCPPSVSQNAQLHPQPAQHTLAHTWKLDTAKEACV